MKHESSVFCLEMTFFGECCMDDESVHRKTRFLGIKSLREFQSARNVSCALGIQEYFSLEEKRLIT